MTQTAPDTKDPVGIKKRHETDDRASRRDPLPLGQISNLNDEQVDLDAFDPECLC